MVVQIDDERFDALVGEALDEIPDELAALVRNVVVLVEDDSPTDGPVLLGLYEGVAMTERDSSMLPGLPDRILIFRRPLLELCESEDHLRQEVRITVVHEVAHHFGINEARLHALGYG